MAKETEKAIDEKNTVTIKLPLTRDKQDDVFVGINGQTWKLQRGAVIEVPEEVAEILANSEAMDQLALTRQMGLPNKE